MNTTIFSSVPALTSSGDALENGFTFVSVDYTLLKPGTAFDMIRDVKRCFQWVSSELKYELAARGFGKIDSQAVAVAGESAGGYLTYLAVSRIRFFHTSSCLLFYRLFMPSPSQRPLLRCTGWAATFCLITTSRSKRSVIAPHRFSTC